MNFGKSQFSLLNKQDNMKKINVEEACKAYNEARMQNIGRKNPSDKMIEILKSFGLSETLSRRMLSSPTLFTRFQREGEGKGNHKGYMFSYNPVHISYFQKWLYPDRKEEPKKDVPFEDECVNYLKEKGYTLKKCVGFNEKQFAADHPELYKKYLQYVDL